MPPWDIFKFHCDPSQWIKLRDLLMEALQDVPPSKWRPGVPVPKSEKPIDERAYYEAEHRKAYQPYGGEVCAACGERFEDGLWPRMTPPIAYYAMVSVRQAVLFVRGLCPEVDGECVTVFPFPDASVREVAAWFTTEWWCRIGYRYFLEVALRGKKTTAP